MSGLTETLDKLVARAAAARLDIEEEPERWLSPPRLHVVIDDPGGKRIVPWAWDLPVGDLINKGVNHA